MIEKKRKATKEYMDKLTNSDPEILALTIDLINPELEDLTETMLNFIEMQLRRDEFIMKIYKEKYELVNPSEDLSNDFYKFYDRGLTLKRSMLIIDRDIAEKNHHSAMVHYTTIFKTLSSMLADIYWYME